MKKSTKRKNNVHVQKHTCIYGLIHVHDKELQ